MFRAMLLALPLLIVPLAAPPPAAASAAASAAAAQSRTGEQCQQRNRNRRRGGAIVGAIGRGLLGRGGGAVANVVLPMSSVLGDAIMSLLDCDEQRKAATATEEVVEQAERGGVGTTATWQSDSRAGVTGSSTVTAVETAAPDGECMTVTDVVIVEGEETRAPKRMCRRPPNNRYVRV